MSLSSPLITPCLWFDNEGEEAAKFYTSIFPESEILSVSHYTEVSVPPWHDRLRCDVPHSRRSPLCRPASPESNQDLKA